MAGVTLEAKSRRKNEMVGESSVYNGNLQTVFSMREIRRSVSRRYIFSRMLLLMMNFGS